MARPSRWASFAESFNAMNGVVTGIGKQYEIARVNKKDYFEDDKKTKLKGDALATARERALSDIYTKYGDPAGGLAIRKAGAEAQTSDRVNRIGAATEDHQIYVNGLGARNQLNADINRMNAAAGASSAAAGASNARAEGFRLDNRVNEATMENRIYVEGQGAVNKLNAGIAASQAAEKASLSSSAFTDANTNKLRRDAASTEAVANILAGVDRSGETSDEAATIDAMKRIYGDPTITPVDKKAAIAALKQFGQDKVLLEATEITNGLTAAALNGLSSYLEYYNENVGDKSSTLKSKKRKDGTIDVIASDGSVVASGQGETADEQIINQLNAYATQGNVLGAAVENLQARKTEAEINQTLAKTELTQGQVDQLIIDGKFTEAQIELTGKNVILKQGQVDQLVLEANLTLAQIRSVDAGVRFTEEQILNMTARTKQVNATTGKLEVDKELAREQIYLVKANVRNVDERTAKIIADVAFNEGVGLKKVNAEIERLKSLTDAAGVSKQVDEQNIKYLAAKIASVEQDTALNEPERPIGPVEKGRRVDKAWTALLGSILRDGLVDSDEELQRMEDLFRRSVTSDSGFSAVLLP